MKALSGVLESSRAALSIRRIFCRIKANSENHLAGSDFHSRDGSYVYVSWAVPTANTGAGGTV
eukprot:scaffold14642_cov83-Skeletonema_dohrnii-CCMP3373.AAC.2